LENILSLRRGKHRTLRHGESRRDQAQKASLTLSSLLFRSYLLAIARLFNFVLC
ncbi:hypothetical protein COCVIDRAFT_85734, partial [Bipolaris victoriae FI3]